MKNLSPVAISRPTLRQGVWCSALLWWLSGMGWGGFALGWIALVPLLWSLENQPARRRFWCGWKCGFLAFALVNWWIALAVTRGAPMIGLPPFIGTLLGALGVLLIAAVHGLGIALAATIWNTSSTRWRHFRLGLPILAAATWTAFDYLRCSGVLAHSWGAPAFSQTGNSALLQIAAVWGQHGLSFACVWMAASIALCLNDARDFRLFKKSVWLAPLLIFTALHCWGFWRLHASAQSSRDLKTLRVLLVQTAASSGNGKMQSAFAQAFAQTENATRENATRENANLEKTRLVVWPETTLSFERFSRSDPNIEYSKEGASEELIGRDIDSLELRQIAQLCRERNISILCGAAVLLRERNGVGTLSNQAILVSPDGTVQFSAKSHLVPFGERSPFVERLSWLRNFAPQPMMEAGTPRVLRLKNADFAVGALICFESCFAQPSRELRRRGADALFVLTNDEWFSGSEAPAQHLQMSRVRAVENNAWVAQSANGGYTFAIDPQGRVQFRSRYGVAQILAFEIAFSAAQK